MEEAKNFITGRDLRFYAGLDETTDKIVVKPYIFNKDETAIKLLNENKILKIDTQNKYKAQLKAIDKNYQLTCMLDINCLVPPFDYKVPYDYFDKISEKKLEKLTKKIQRYADKTYKAVKEAMQEREKRQKAEESYQSF